MKNQIIERFPGIGCTWVNAAGEYAEEYFGFADKENKVVVDENTIFPACSISKFITALCVMKLHEQKLIDVDKPANLYLKQWKLHTAEGNESNATIRAILCHTAGILDGEDAFYGLRRGDPEITLIDILDGKPLTIIVQPALKKIRELLLNIPMPATAYCSCLFRKLVRNLLKILQRK